METSSMLDASIGEGGEDLMIVTFIIGKERRGLGPSTHRTCEGKGKGSLNYIGGGGGQEKVT